MSPSINKKGRQQKRIKFLTVKARGKKKQTNTRTEITIIKVAINETDNSKSVCKLITKPGSWGRQTNVGENPNSKI